MSWSVTGLSVLVWMTASMLWLRRRTALGIAKFLAGDATGQDPHLAPGLEHGGGQFLAAADAELVEHGPEVFLDGVLADGQLADDLLGGVSAQDHLPAGDGKALSGGRAGDVDA